MDRLIGKYLTSLTDLHIIAAFILLMDVAIFINLPVFRPFFALICLLLIPGYLFIQFLQIRIDRYIDKFLLSLGVSLAFLMFFGLFLSTISPILGYLSPLAPTYLIFSVNIVLFSFLGVLILQKKAVRISICPQEVTGALISPTLIPFLFPLMSVIGAYQVSWYNENLLVVIVYISIAAYICVLCVIRKRINPITYPIALGCIAVAVIFSRSLISDYLIGGDIYAEFFAFRSVFDNNCWPGTDFHNMVVDSLGVSIIPSVLSSSSALSPVITFKAIIPLIIAFIPVICYCLFSKFLMPFDAFLAAAFVIFQIPFLTLLASQLRVGVAIIFFIYTVYFYLDIQTSERNKTVLLLLFLLSVVFVYYATPIIMLIIFAGSLFAYYLFMPCMKCKLCSTTTMVVVLLLASIFFWWGLSSSGGAFNAYIVDTSEIFANLGDFFVDSARSNTIQRMSLSDDVSLPYKISALLNVFCYILLSIGVIYSIRSKLTIKTEKEGKYVIVMLVSLLLLIAWLILPYVSVLYGAQRALLQIIVILAPSMIFGGSYLCRVLKKEKYSHIFLTILIICLLFTNSYLLHYFLGLSDNIVFDRSNEVGDLLYVYGGEIVGAQWVADNGNDDVGIYLGSLHHSRGIFVYTDEFDTIGSRIFSFRELDINSRGYVFLRWINIDKDYGFKLTAGDSYEKYSLSNYAPLLERYNLIYQNRYCKIYNYY